MESSAAGKEGNKETPPIMVDNLVAITFPSHRSGSASKHGFGSWADVLDEDELELEEGEFVDTDVIGNDGTLESIPIATNAGGGEGVDPVFTGGSEMAAGKGIESTSGVVTSTNC
ncbi:hypothetical protein NE237_004214 [Protea cynaroides]|uniref:Uncharacterized protein n=1 Tax=Protea cynaroides TaxID=273540 RepID=A0A9Q0QTC4_9MAGN|nr:hypothetical protein NE237_004214 [Protea cynaroides]